MKEIRRELNKWRDIPWIGRLNTVKISVLPNLIYKFSAITIKMSANDLVTDKLIKFIWRGKNPE